LNEEFFESCSCIDRKRQGTQLFIISLHLSQGIPFLWSSKNSVLVSCKIFFHVPNVLDFSISVIYDISENAQEHFEFPTVGENV